MHSPLGKYIHDRRKALDITQEAAALALGVCRPVFARWESGERSVPVGILPDLAPVIKADVELLAQLRDRAPKRIVESVREYAPLTPIDCSIEEMLARMPQAQHLHDSVRATISEGQYQDLRLNFLRQTPAELALAFVAIRDRGELVWTSLLDAGSRLLSIGEDRRSYLGHLLRLGIFWQDARERISLQPQVPLLVPQSDKCYRVDYVATHVIAGRPPTDVVIELDGAPHRFQTVRDEVRADDLKLPLLRFDNKAVLSERFFIWLIENIRKKAEAARISHAEYARFLKRKRNRYDEMERGA